MGRQSSLPRADGPATAILGLQRLAGNAAVASLLGRSVQRRLALPDQAPAAPAPQGPHPDPARDDEDEPQGPHPDPDRMGQPIGSDDDEPQGPHPDPMRPGRRIRDGEDEEPQGPHPDPDRMGRRLRRYWQADGPHPGDGYYVDEDGRQLEPGTENLYVDGDAEDADDEPQGPHPDPMRPGRRIRDDEDEGPQGPHPG